MSWLEWVDRLRAAGMTDADIKNALEDVEREALEDLRIRERTPRPSFGAKLGRHGCTFTGDGIRHAASCRWKQTHA